MNLLKSARPSDNQGSTMGTTPAIVKSPRIIVKSAGDEKILFISGGGDAKCADMLASEIQRQVHSGATKLTLDLSQADFIETPVLRVIMDWAQQLSLSDASLTVRRLSSSAKRTFDLLKLDWLLTEDETRQMN